MEKKSIASSFEIEHLLKLAFARTKNRFVSYLLTMILFWVVGMAVFIGIAIILIIVGLILSLTKILALSIVIGAIMLISAYIVFIYIMAWGQLAMVQVLIDNISAMQALKKVKPLIWGYFIYSLFFGLFILGLFPLGILSLGIIFLFWIIWNLFSIFVYLDYKKIGLQNLWHSRALISKQFWGVVLRIGIVYVGYYILMVLLSMAGKNNGLVSVMIVILSFVASPFLKSYMYEMYLTLKSDVSVKPPKVWIGLSIIGGILVVLSVIGMISVAINQGPALLKGVEDNMKQNQNKTPSNSIKIPTATTDYKY